MILQTTLLSYDIVYFLLEKDKHQYPWKNDHHNCEPHVCMSDIGRNVHKINTV